MCPSSRDGSCSSTTSSGHSLAGPHSMIWHHISKSPSSSSFASSSSASSLAPSRLHEAFRFLDRDGDGEIRSHDLASFFASCVGRAISQEEAESMIHMADLDGNGAVDMDEFHRLLTDSESEAFLDLDVAEEARECKGSTLREMFDVLDANKDGLISREDLRSAMVMLGQPMSEEELDAMLFAAVSPSSANCGHDSVDLESFSKLLSSPQDDW